MKRLSTEIFIKKARKIHGDKYDYSKVVYVNNRTKVCIICPIHGEFWQTPNAHLSGHGCFKCVGICESSEDFIKKAREVHGNKYDYSKVEYINSTTKVCIICPVHGEFWQTPDNHINSKSGCPKCKFGHISDYLSLTTETFIEKAKMVHGDKYDYSKVVYVNNCTKVCIICPIHGEFWQTPNNHLNGQGCGLCYGTHKIGKDNFIKMAREIHGNKYDYSKVVYIDSRTKVCIICPIHGEFWQTPDGHLRQKQGCPICNESKLEKEVRIILESNKINHIQQYRTGWLGKQSLDFYLPDYNIAIECQGIQHFKPIDFFGGEKAFKKQIEYDKLKEKKCKENGIKLLLYTNDNDIYCNKHTILQEIKK